MSRSPQCVECKFAEWKKTSAGRLHPSGDGKCRWEYPHVRLPVSMYFIGGASEPNGGYISRRDEWKQCPQFQRSES